MPWKSLGPWRFVYVWFNPMPVTEHPLTHTYGMIAMVVNPNVLSNLKVSSILCNIQLDTLEILLTNNEILPTLSGKSDN